MAHAPRPPDPARLAARPLAGRRIAVTRAHEQAGDLTRELEALGAEVVAAPTIRIAPLADLAALRAALTRVPPYDWIVFTSQNAVQVMCDRLPEWELAPRDVARAAVAAIGPATAEALVRHGVVPDLVPDRFVAEAVVAALAARGDVRGKTVLLPRARAARAGRAGRRDPRVRDHPRDRRWQETGGGNPRRDDRRRHLHVLIDSAGLRRAGGRAGGGVRSVHRGGDRARDGGDGPGARDHRCNRGSGLHGPRPRGCDRAALHGGRVTAFKLGTRGSKLAMWQAEWVKRALAGAGVAAELVIIKTRGDAEVDRPLHELEGKGFFTKEIEDALRDGRIDVAVHSLKDLPTSLPAGLMLAAVPLRADPSEALVTRERGVTSIAELAAGARLGTSSLRRVAQVRYLRTDLNIVPLRGNVPTRVQKVKEGRDGLDAALLAAAGLERLDLQGQIAARLDPLDVMPAPGQGALGLEVRADDRKARDTLAPLEDPASARQVAAERSLLAALEGGCQAPVAAYCGKRDTGSGGEVLYGRVTAQDGSVQITASTEIDVREPAAAGVRVAALLRAQGASKLLGR